MRTLMNFDDLDAIRNAPPHVHRTAVKRNKKILKITWDEEGGYPEHSWGYVQWSTRPFTQKQGCDGTIDMNVHLIALLFCERLGLDYPALYEKAYAWQKREGNSGDWLRNFPRGEVMAETVVPELSTRSLRNLLHDLNDINNSSVVEILEEEFEKLGHDMEGWHER